MLSAFGQINQTLQYVLDRSYIKATNYSNVSMSDCDTASVVVLRLRNTYVASSSSFHACQAGRGTVVRRNVTANFRSPKSWNKFISSM